MSALCWLFCVLLFFLFDGVQPWFEVDDYRRGGVRRAFSYPRDWDVDWTASQRRYQGGYHEYQADGTISELRPRLEVVPRTKVDTRGVWHSQQRGSVLVPRPGVEVRVRPNRGSSKFYRGTITSTVSDPSFPAHRRDHGRPNKGVEYWRYTGEESVPRESKVCARCPSDRAVLARRGSNSVLMEVPPLIPCHPWSSVEKVRQEILVGPRPGEEVPEGSHKIVIRLSHRRRILATCVIRYNVIVRQCEVLHPGPGVRVTCPRGRAWGAACNFSCGPGYQLEGDTHSDCMDNLEWSGDIPTCLPTTSCAAPSGPDHGHISCRTPNHQPAAAPNMLPDGSVCHYRCDGGYSVPLTQQGFVEMRCVAGSWDSHTDPACVETNDLEDEDLPTEINDSSGLSFDSTGCPEGFCRNGGRCLMILDAPMCSCLTGYSGLFCEDQDTGPDLENSIT